MKIENLTILGSSEATISMIFDNLESLNCFPNIEIINNLNYFLIKDFHNNKFKYKIVEKQTLENSNFIVGAFRSKTKKQIVETFNHISCYINLIHQSSQISSTSTIGYGCLINSLVSIAAHSHLSNFVSVNRNASIGHHCCLENFVTVNPNASIAGSVYIGEQSTIGINATILDGVKIGKNSIIGAGSLVTKNVPDNVVAYGNPCKIIRDNI